MKRFTKVALTSMLLLVLITGASIGLVYHSQKVEPARLQGKQIVLVYDNEDRLVNDHIETEQVKLANIQPHTLNAFISIEDKNFFKHKGLAPRRIASAAMRNLRSGYAKEGASTITQQLVKNTHLNREKTMQRKLREAALAHKIERRYSKNQILEMYLNVIYFGNGINGIESASRFYFGKSAVDLTIRESASLAAIIKSPARFCPVNQSDNLSERTNLVLRQMYLQGFIAEEQYENSKSEKLVVVAKRKIPVSSTFINAATQEAAKILDVSTSDLVAYGYKVFTYYDADHQSALVNTSTNYQIKNKSNSNADKVLILANPKGQVTAYHSTNPTLFNAKRNLASAMKPLVVYAPALELGVVQPATHIVDEPFTVDGFNPRNFDAQYLGPVSVRQCITQSRNIPAVKTLEYVKVNRAADVARRMGLSLKDENLSLALGNTSQGTTFFEIVGGYAAFCNGGYGVKPTLIKRIENRDGVSVYENISNQNIRAIGEDTAYLVTDMLVDTVKNGTARKLGLLDFAVAAKTGTGERDDSLDNTDAVCVAYTPEIVLLVWTGNTDMKVENDLPKGTTGGGVCTFIARDVLGHFKTEKEFEIPASVDKFEFDLQDAKLGLLTSTHDNTPKDNKATELFARRFAPSRPSANFQKLNPVALDGKIGDTGVPYVFFNASPSQTYEIFKVIDGKKVLQEVVTNQSGEYMFFDKSAKAQKTQEYYVVTKILTNAKEEVTSNTVKLQAPKNLNTTSKAVEHKKPNSGKQWYF